METVDIASHSTYRFATVIINLGGHMSYRIESVVTINAPAATVWAFVQDVTRRVEWDARVTHVTLLTDPPVEKGARIRVAYRLFGVPMHVDIEMIAWKPPAKSAVRGVFSGTPDHMGASWQFISNNDGSTTWITKLVITGEGRLGRVRAWLTGTMVGRLTRVSQLNVKRIVEAEYVANNHAGLSRSPS
jgi:hypothetical protein